MSLQSVVPLFVCWLFCFVVCLLFWFLFGWGFLGGFFGCFFFGGVSAFSKDEKEVMRRDTVFKVSAEL